MGHRNAARRLPGRCPRAAAVPPAAAGGAGDSMRCTARGSRSSPSPSGRWTAPLRCLGRALRRQAEGEVHQRPRRPWRRPRRSISRTAKRTSLPGGWASSIRRPARFAPDSGRSRRPQAKRPWDQSRHIPQDSTKSMRLHPHFVKKTWIRMQLSSSSAGRARCLETPRLRCWCISTGRPAFLRWPLEKKGRLGEKRGGTPEPSSASATS